MGSLAGSAVKGRKIPVLDSSVLGIAAKSLGANKDKDENKNKRRAAAAAAVLAHNRGLPSGGYGPGSSIVSATERPRGAGSRLIG